MFGALLVGAGVEEDAERAENDDDTSGLEVTIKPVTRNADGGARYDFGTVLSDDDDPGATARLTIRNGVAADRFLEKIFIGYGSLCGEFAISVDIEQQCPFDTGKGDTNWGQVKVMGALASYGREDRNLLWQVNETYDSGEYIGWYKKGAHEIREGSRFWSKDGINIDIRNSSLDTYEVYITRDEVKGKPDMMVRPWRSNPAPGAYETTDIWIDSPINGYC